MIMEAPLDPSDQRIFTLGIPIERLTDVPGQRDVSGPRSRFGIGGSNEILSVSYSVAHEFVTATLIVPAFVTVNWDPVEPSCHSQVSTLANMGWMTMVSPAQMEVSMPNCTEGEATPDEITTVSVLDPHVLEIVMAYTPGIDTESCGRIDPSLHA